MGQRNGNNMTGIFHSVDLIVKGESSGHRAECRSNLILANIAIDEHIEVLAPIWFIPFESDGYTIFDTYTFGAIQMMALDGDPRNPVSYGFEAAVYRQYSNLGDTASAAGVGELVPGTNLSVTGWGGSHIINNTAALDDPVILPQGSYWIAWHPTFSLDDGGIGSLLISCTNGINCLTASETWVNHSHLYGVIPTWGTLPDPMTTNGGTMLQLTPTFQFADAFWAAIFDSRDAYP